MFLSAFLISPPAGHDPLEKVAEKILNIGIGQMLLLWFTPTSEVFYPSQKDWAGSDSVVDEKL